MRIMTQVSDNFYSSEDGWIMRREVETRTPGGNLVNGKWVLRNPAGEFVDFNQYRHDLACHHNLDLR